MRRYFDYNATAPMLDQVAEAWLNAVKQAVGNPSSMHWAGRTARRMLDDARDELANHLHVEPGSIVFTGGGTESNNLAIASCLLALPAREQPRKVVTTAIEHPSVLQTLNYWCERLELQLLQIKPNADGVVDSETFCAAIDEQTVLACMMWANNEIGTIQPVKSMVKHCRKLAVPCLVDAVQAMAKVDMDLGKLDADFVSLSAHKIGGPKGVACLVVRRGQRLESWLHGGGQERGRRSGTENVAAAVGFAKALGGLDYTLCQSVRDAFEARMLEAMPDVVVYGKAANRVDNTSMFTVPGMDGETLLMQLDLAGFAVASGSACSSGKRQPSHVLLAMGVDERLARSSLRISFGPEHTHDDAKALVDELVRIRALLQSMAGI